MLQFDPASQPASRRTKLFAVLSALIVAAAIDLAEAERFRVSVAADLRLLLIVTQISLLVGTLWVCRAEMVWRQRMQLIAIATFALGVMIIVAFRWHWRLIYLSLAVLLRSYYPVLLVLIGTWLLVLVISFRKQTLRWNRFAPNVFRLGLAAVFVGVSLEVVAYLLQPVWTPDYTLPDLPPAQTTENHRTVVAIGGSTMVGLPYAPRFGILPAATWYLRRAYPDLSIDVQNLAVTGINQRRAISTLTQLKTRPDVIVVYAGHNEFFHESSEMAAIRMTSFGKIDDWLLPFPTFRIINPVLSQYLMGQSSWVTERTLIDPPVCPESVGKVRQQRFQAELRQLLQWAEAQDIHIIYCAVASDTATFEPNFSSCQNCGPTDENRLQKEWQQVRQLQQKEVWAAALGRCREVLQSYPDVAEFHFRAGQCLQKLQQFAAADHHFTTARNLDGFPIRAISDYTDAAVATAQQANVPIIDVRDVLSAATTDGLLSDEVFLDGVHPNLSACHLVGHAIAGQMIQADVLDAGPAERTAADRAQCLAESGLSATHIANAYEKTAEVLTHYAEFRPFDQTARRNRAARLRTIAGQMRTGAVDPFNNLIERPAEALAVDDRVMDSSPPNSDWQPAAKTAHSER